MNLGRLHYQTSTNLGLLQANTTWIYKKLGPEFSWIVELHKRMGLPVYKSVAEHCRKAREKRHAVLEKKKTAEAKAKRIERKCAIQEDHQARIEYGARQKVKHTYGRDDDTPRQKGGKRKEMPSSATQEGAAEEHGEQARPPTKKPCRCGSLTHFRTSHKDCPMKKQKRNSDTISCIV
eukprot:m.86980 g.86980  ORF g.86980 m.86980 type:complete len:178 (+) comp36522_c0_seq1:1660-2193(+)